VAIERATRQLVLRRLGGDSSRTDRPGPLAVALLTSAYHRRGTEHSNDMTLYDCPTCALPTTAESRGSCDSTDGPVELVSALCVAGHWFLGPAERLISGSVRLPVPPDGGVPPPGSEPNPPGGEPDQARSMNQ